MKGEKRENRGTALGRAVGFPRFGFPRFTFHISRLSDWRTPCGAFFLCLALLGGCASHPAPELVLRITDWRTTAVYVEAPVKTNSRLLFAWIHSLEKIPWNEYYHVDERLNLVLDEITFPAFGAGIPEDKGRVTYVRDGLIHMEEIGQVFSELVWLNSHIATRELVLDGVRIACGSTLPEHTRLRLAIEKR